MRDVGRYGHSGHLVCSYDQKRMMTTGRQRPQSVIALEKGITR
jgi:hypothetical protein